jgi:hypothetical protein
MVEATYVDGRVAYERQTTSSVLAIRAGRIHDGTGRVHRDGIAIVQDGRIKAVGEDLAIPYGATVVDLPDAVMTPGFVDAFSHLGLAGEGTGVPPGAPGQPLHDAIAFDDPREGMVVRPIVGQRLTHDAIGPDAVKALADQIARGKAYAKQWADYEKALAEWRTGGKPAAEPKKEEAPKPADDKEKAVEGRDRHPGPDPPQGRARARSRRHQGHRQGAHLVRPARTA